jgi:hypothetical protein
MYSNQVVAPHTIPCRLSMSILEVDPDYLRLDISVADGDFAGRAEIFESLELPTTLAAALQGFPRTADDRREIVLGSFDPSMAGGGIKLVFRCVDRSGHAVLDAELEDQPWNDAPRRSVVLRMAVTPPAIDSFVAEMSSWSPQAGEQRVLHGAA